MISANQMQMLSILIDGMAGCHGLICFRRAYSLNGKNALTIAFMCAFAGGAGYFLLHFVGLFLIDTPMIGPMTHGPGQLAIFLGRISAWLGMGLSEWYFRGQVMRGPPKGS